jgi:hypothetical protein
LVWLVLWLLLWLLSLLLCLLLWRHPILQHCGGRG